MSAWSKPQINAASVVHGFGYLGTLDLRHAYDSVRPFLLRYGLRRIGVQSELILELMLRFGSLPTGSPSSGVGLELALLRSDERIAERAEALGVRVVRWVGDYAFAGDDREGLIGVMREARAVLRSDSLETHSKGRAICPRGAGQEFLGYSLEDNISVPRRMRKKWERRLRELEGGALSDVEAAELAQAIRGYAQGYLRHAMPGVAGRLMERLQALDRGEP